jgi:hypothetical protein
MAFVLTRSMVALGVVAAAYLAGALHEACGVSLLLVAPVIFPANYPPPALLELVSDEARARLVFSSPGRQQRVYEPVTPPAAARR